jgi:ligand-binding SRPBCC domain-containing protein
MEDILTKSIFVCYYHMSKVYQLKKVQIVPATIEATWRFFSSPENLKEITPPHLGFKVLSISHGNKMYAGQIIEYTVKPLLGIPLYWMTEITHVEPMKYFIDEQRFGPYAFWHHQHHFKETNNGIEMTDIVHYKIPFWFMGDIANSLFVKKQLKKIFDYRTEVTDKRFGK